MAGKSLYVKRLQESLERTLRGTSVPRKIIRLIDPQVDENQVLGFLLPFLGPQYQTRPMIFHFDVTSSVSAWGARPSGHVRSDTAPRPVLPPPQARGLP